MMLNQNDTLHYIPDILESIKETMDQYITSYDIVVNEDQY